MRAIVVIPTYNERENLEQLITRIRESAPGLHILVVDDSSPDGTGRIADELSGKHPNTVFVLHREKKEGLGRAYVAGFEYALSDGYEAILQMDADLSHDPSYLPEMITMIEQFDLVQGSRYLRGINVVNWDFKRLLLSKTATKYVQLITGMRFTDATTGFKCWRRRALESLGLDAVLSNGYLFQIEMTYKAFRKGFLIKEIPIIFYERNLGRSKMDWAVIREAVWGVLRLRLSTRSQQIPAKADVQIREVTP
jgi:dolichol-phosphate mannosyltransferase